MVDPTNRKPRFCRSLLRASDSAVFAGTLLWLFQPFCLGCPPTKSHTYASNVWLFVGGQPKQKDRKSTRLNSSHVAISYAVFCSKTKMLPHLFACRARSKLPLFTYLSTLLTPASIAPFSPPLSSLHPPASRFLSIASSALSLRFN